MQKLPLVALGAWSWGSGAAGGDQVFGNKLTSSDLQPVFAEAVESGLTLWDTAAVYGMGASEKILGSFIRSYPREQLQISTKFTPQIQDGTPDAMEHMLAQSMSRLGTDYIDIYWIHNPFDVEKWTPYLSALVKAGKVGSVGVSNHNLKEIKRASEILAKDGIKLSAVQNHFSLLNRSSERGGILDYCKENGITFYAYMVLEQGALTGRFSEANPFPAGSDRANSYNPILSKLDTLIAKMNEIGAKYSLSPAQVATAWAIAKGTLPIIGVTKVKQVQDAVNASKVSLTAEEVATLEAIADKIEISTVREWEKDMD